MRRLIALALFIAFAPPVRSETQPAVKLHALFSDGLVLQQGLAFPVWDWAGAGEEITVTIAGQKKTG